MDNIIEFEIRKNVELTDGMKWLVYYLRKNKLEFKEIGRLITRLTELEPHHKTLQTIFMSINNRLQHSLVFKESNTTFTVFSNLANLLTHQLMKLRWRGYEVYVNMNTIDKPEFAYQYIFQAQGKDLYFRMTLFITYSGSGWLRVEEMKPTMTARFDKLIDVAKHLAHTEYVITNILNGD